MQHPIRTKDLADCIVAGAGKNSTIDASLAVLLFCCGCAVDSPRTDDSVASDPTTTGSASEDSDGAQASATVVELGAWPFCSSAPAHRDPEDHSWLFRAKYRTQLTPGMYPVLPGSSLPYALEVHGEPTATAVVDDDRNAFIIVAGKPRYGEVGGVEIDDDPTHESLVFDEVFRIEPPVVDSPWLGEEPVSEAWIRVISSRPSAGEPGETGQFIVDENAVVEVFEIAPMAACGANRPSAAVTHVELDGGRIDFESIPVPLAGSAITTRAVGDIDGIAIDVSDYLELDYSSWGVGYLADPMFAVRLPTLGPSGECSLYVFLRNDADSTLSDSEAWWLDCDGARLREVEVTDFDSVLPDE